MSMPMARSGWWTGTREPEPSPPPPRPEPETASLQPTSSSSSRPIEYFTAAPTPAHAPSLRERAFIIAGRRCPRGRAESPSECGAGERRSAQRRHRSGLPDSGYRSPGEHDHFAGVGRHRSSDLTRSSKSCFPRSRSARGGSISRQDCSNG